MTADLKSLNEDNYKKVIFSVELSFKKLFLKSLYGGGFFYCKMHILSAHSFPRLSACVPRLQIKRWMTAGDIQRVIQQIFSK